MEIALKLRQRNPLLSVYLQFDKKQCMVFWFSFSQCGAMILESPSTTTVVELMETEKVEEKEVEGDKVKSKKKKKRNITWATDDKLVEYHYYEPDDEERGREICLLSLIAN